MKFDDYQIKRPNGRRIRITIELYQQSFAKAMQWKFQLSVCEPRKRSFIFIADGWGNENRGKTEDELIAERMQYITQDELYRAKMKAWYDLQPKATAPQQGEKGAESEA